MAAKTGKSAGSVTKRVSRKAGTVTAAPTRAEDVAPAPEVGGARALIRAGLKALGDVRGDMVARQTRVFELLLGIGQSPAWRAASNKGAAGATSSALDPFGKFEEVFDQRVARSLERLGMPSPEQLRELADQVSRLSDLLQSIEPRQRKR